jgi:hypothetical protein
VKIRNTPGHFAMAKKKGKKKEKKVVRRAEGEGVLSLCGLAESHVTQAL